MHIEDLTVAFVAANGSRDNDKSVPGHKVADTSLFVGLFIARMSLYVKLQGLGQVEEKQGDGQDRKSQEVSHHDARGTVTEMYDQRKGDAMIMSQKIAKENLIIFVVRVIGILGRPRWSDVRTELPSQEVDEPSSEYLR